MILSIHYPDVTISIRHPEALARSCARASKGDGPDGVTATASGTGGGRSSFEAPPERAGHLRMTELRFVAGGENPCAAA